jgi:hypothetical protein
MKLLKRSPIKLSKLAFNHFYLIILITLICLTPWLTVACNTQQPQAPLQSTASTEPTLPKPAATNLTKPTFDGERAMTHVRRQVEFGPRYAGTPALQETRQYLINELKSYKLEVREDRFTATTPNPKFPKVEMSNLIATLPGEQSEVVIIGSHYDTKWFPDIKFLGANDAGSSTGILLELARQLAGKKLKYTVWFVFFDGEEPLNGEWQGTDHTYGSAHMVNTLRQDGKLRDIKALILLDMVGDKKLNIARDFNSLNWLNDIIWQTADRLGYNQQFQNQTIGIEDDHIPFLQAGIPAVDIIDFDYGPNNSYWHTSQDTIDKISPESLKIVGEVVLQSLPEIMQRLR